MSNQMIASHGTLQSSKEILVRDLQRVVGDANELLSNVVDASVEELASTGSKIEAGLGAARSRLDDARIVLGKKAGLAAEASEAYVRENPWTVFGVTAAAAAVGLAAVLLLKRR